MEKRLKFVDLSLPVEAGPIPGAPENLAKFLLAEIRYDSHKDTVEEAKAFFGCTEGDLPGGEAWALEYLNLTTHIATHMDAPWHYGATSGGKKAKTIDEIPLEWCYGDGVVLDMRHKKPGEEITVADLQESLRKIGYEIKPGDIVLIMTGADKHWGTAKYLSERPGMGRESTLWLIEQGVRVMGIDAIGWDRPFRVMAEEFKRTGDSSVIWAAHYAGMTREFCNVEKLANLDQLPPYGFKVALFPVKIKGASGGWVRAVAIIEG